MNLRVNQAVTTPFGRGVVEGCYGTFNRDGLIATGVHWLVRLPVNEETKKALTRGNCLTPCAKEEGLWIFEERELK